MSTRIMGLMKFRPGCVMINAEEFSVSWIAYLCSTSNLPGNTSWVYGRHEPPYLCSQQGEQRGYREIVMFFLEILKWFRHGILL